MFKLPATCIAWNSPTNNLWMYTTYHIFSLYSKTLSMHPIAALEHKSDVFCWALLLSFARSTIDNSISLIPRGGWKLCLCAWLSHRLFGVFQLLIIYIRSPISHVSKLPDMTSVTLNWLHQKWFTNPILPAQNGPPPKQVVPSWLNQNYMVLFPSFEG